MVLDAELGHMVKDMMMKFVEEISLISFLDFFLGPFLEGKVLKMAPFQRQKKGDQHTSSKVSLASGDHNDPLI